MIVDSRELPKDETIKADVCVIGAGVAGITLAREFIGKGLSVSLLESGGFVPDKETQSLYWGANTGVPYYNLDQARARFFGGSSSCWRTPTGDDRLGIKLRPLDRIDFEKRDWLPYSGWPFDKEHLDPYYDRAQSVYQVGPNSYEPEQWEDAVEAPRLPFMNGRVKTAMFQVGPKEIFFNDYRKEISQAENITTYLYANAIEMESTDDAQAVSRVRIGCLDGKRLWASAKLYVLAMGGIEVPRLLLNSNKAHRNGLGNENDLVGRFFMEHLHLPSGIFVPTSDNIFKSMELYRIRRVNNLTTMGNLVLSEEVLRSEKMPNYCVSLQPGFFPDQHYQLMESRGFDSLKEIRSAFFRGTVPPDVKKHLGNIISDMDGIAVNVMRKVKMTSKVKSFLLNHMSEQVPNPDSRVALMDERDALGQRRVSLNWQLSPMDIRGIIRAQEIIDEELRASAMGRIYIEIKDDVPPSKLYGGYHHMGTTRMSDNPQNGVVDKDCRVHGVHNLFIASSSVFPTGGYANPSLTIVALALRLADKVKKLVGSG